MAEIADRKRDNETANIVRSGLIVLGLYGPSVAARWMRMRGVPLAVAHRVITQPGARRRGDHVLVARPAAQPARPAWTTSSVSSIGLNGLSM